MTLPEEIAIRPCAGCGRTTHPRYSSPPSGVKSQPRRDARYCLACYKLYSPAYAKHREAEVKKLEARKEAKLAAAFQAKETYLAARRRRQALAAARVNA